MAPSLYDPGIFEKFIAKKKQLLADIERELGSLPLEHPWRLTKLERRLYLQREIPALEAEYTRRTSGSESPPTHRNSDSFEKQRDIRGHASDKDATIIPDLSVGDVAATFLAGAPGNAPDQERRSEQSGESAAGPGKRGASSSALLSRYRSEIKRGILMQLTLNPRATDSEVCRGLDADGAIEIPNSWKTKTGDRGFFKAYADPDLRHRVEVAISKVRDNLRKHGLLAPR